MGGKRVKAITQVVNNRIEFKVSVHETLLSRKLGTQKWYTTRLNNQSWKINE